MSMLKEFESRDTDDIKENIKVTVIDSSMVYYDIKAEEDYIIFLSTHTSASKKPCLTVHSIGNWGKAELGGKDKTLVKTSPELIQVLLRNQYEEFTANPIPEWEVAIEATHHGPTTNKPTVFFEIGSSEKEWTNKQAAKININALIKTIKFFKENEKTLNEKMMNKNKERYIFLGNTHYPKKARDLILNGTLIGHICPKYNLENFDENMIMQALEKSNATKVLLDRKGMGKEKRRIITMLEEKGIEYKKV